MNLILQSKRPIGLHLRLEHTLTAVIERALSLHLDFFQCFFVTTAEKLLVLDHQDRASFLSLRKNFNALFVHGSYWINLADRKQAGLHIIERELALARQCEFNYFVLHPGSARGVQTREQGIDLLARALNRLFKRESEIIIVLENTAHGNMSIGSDLGDFALLKQKLDDPTRFALCLDTAHAYVFGYDINDATKRDELYQTIENSLGLSSIVLIHLNDTSSACGSRIDNHVAVGKGILGEETLRRCVDHPALAATPLLMELSHATREQEQEVLATVRSWYQ